MTLINNFNSLYGKIIDTTSNNEKIEILQQAIKDPKMLLFLELLLDKTRPFGVKATNIKKRMKTHPDGTEHDLDLQKLCLGLSERLLTGYTALDYIIYFIRQNSEHTELLLKIFDKKLNARITSLTLNKALGDEVDLPWKVALGENATANILEKINTDEYLISRKLDGVRCITIIKSKTDIRFYSRQNKEFFSCDIIKNCITFTEPMILDGEITVDNGGDNFKGVMQMIRKKEPMKNCLYNVFDILTMEEFFSHSGIVPLSARLERNFKTCDKYIQTVKQYPFSSLNKMKDRVKTEGWEGLILRRDAFYIGKRSKDILKVKEFFTSEYCVLSIESGVIQEKVGTNFKDTIALKNVVIDLGGGVTCSVGSGFSIEERKLYHKTPNKIVGKIIGVQYFEKSESGKLRFPTFLFLYGNTRDI
jgi:DNA ligase-1